MIRIELPPGLETQVDYGRVGSLADRGTNRVVWAFCGLLTHGRLPYVEFVWSQDQRSFAGSFASMWHYYGGSTEFVSLDNLKAGVLKPDLWESAVQPCSGRGGRALRRVPRSVPGRAQHRQGQRSNDSSAPSASSSWPRWTPTNWPASPISTSASTPGWKASITVRRTAA